MVTGEWLRQKLVEPLKEKQRQEGYAEGFAEGLAEVRQEIKEEEQRTHKLWREWLEREAEAKAKGESFNEPPPYSRPAIPTVEIVSVTEVKHSHSHKTIRVTLDIHQPNAD